MPSKHYSFAFDVIILQTLFSLPAVTKMEDLVRYCYWDSSIYISVFCLLDNYVFKPVENCDKKEQGLIRYL